MPISGHTGAVLVFMFGKKKEKIDVRALVEASGLRHIAFIMDGNGRWATAKGLPREAGHSAGAKNFKSVVRYCKSIGIGYVTVYAFSTENWRRPAREVNAIMALLDSYMVEAREEPDVEFRFIGDMAPLDEKIKAKIAELEAFTKGREYRLNIALNYGGRAEIINAVKQA
ncbi:MAG: di-trans,poly-cis-decaprenylcistransferase, partial [Clostridia bacterium]|nr:di-trans,poly-cis-decaprenylcistransferase [Clostridia bacterium]